MTSKIKTYPVDQSSAKEYIVIDEKNKSSNGCLRVVYYIDKDTNQHIAYVPSLEITGYGDTESEAKDLLYVGIEKFFDHLFSSSVQRVYDEMSPLGWSRRWFKHKEFSRTYVDVTGELKNFAVQNSIKQEEMQLT